MADIILQHRLTLYFKPLMIVLLIMLILYSIKNYINQIDFFHPLIGFPVAYSLFFIFGSINFIDDPNINGFSLFKPMTLYIYIYWLIGLVCFYIGYLFFSLILKKESKVKSNKKRSNEKGLPNNNFPILILFGLGNVVYISIITKYGIPILANDVSQLRIDATSNGLFTTVLLSAYWCCMLLLFAHIIHSKIGRYKKIIFMALIVIMLIELYSLGNRGYIFGPLITMLFMYHFIKRKIEVHRLLLTGMGLFTLFGFMGLQRNISHFGEYYVSQLLNWGFKEEFLWLVPSYLYIRTPISTFREISTLIPESVEFQFGKQFLSPFASLLPGSNESTDLFFKKILELDFVGFGTPATLLGVFYSDLGILGIILGMFFVSLITFITYNNMIIKQTVESKIYYAYLLKVLFMSLYGSFFPYFIVLWIPILIKIAIDFSKVVSLKELPGKYVKTTNR